LTRFIETRCIIGLCKYFFLNTVGLCAKFLDNVGINLHYHDNAVVQFYWRTLYEFELDKRVRVRHPIVTNETSAGRCTHVNELLHRKPPVLSRSACRTHLITRRLLRDYTLINFLTRDRRRW